MKGLADGQTASQFKYDSVEDFLAALGSGELTAHQIAAKLAPEAAAPAMAEVCPAERSGFMGAEIVGVGTLLARLARRV